MSEEIGPLTKEDIEYLEHLYMRAIKEQQKKQEDEENISGCSNLY